MSKIRAEIEQVIGRKLAEAEWIMIAARIEEYSNRRYDNGYVDGMQVPREWY